MSSQSFLERLARRCGAHPWRVLAVWAVALVACGALIALFLGDNLSGDGNFTNEPESVRADKLISERTNPTDQVTELVVVKSATLTVDDAAFSAKVDAVAAAATGLGGDVVSSAVGYTMAPDPSLVSIDRHAAIVSVAMPGTVDDVTPHLEELHSAVKGAGEAGDFEVLVTGNASIQQEFNEIGETDLRTGETFGIGVALIILVLVFGAVVAAGIPLALAVVSIVVALAMAAVTSQVLELSSFITNMVTMIGLAMGIDYSLFIISRFREERQAGRPKLDAVARTGGTAGRAVLFSGGCVVLALAGLLLVPSSIFHSMALGAMFAVFGAVLAALTLLPAVLGLLGDRVDSLRVPFLGRARREGRVDRGFWHWAGHSVMRRPVVSLVLACGLLLAASSFYFQLDKGAGGADTMPPKAESGRAYQILAREFPSSLLSSVYVAVDGDAADPGVIAAVERLTASIENEPAFEGAVTTQVAPSGDLTVLQFPQTANLTFAQARAAVEKLRETYVPAAFSGVSAEALVTGQTAGITDYLETIDGYTPWVFLFVLSLSFVFLMAVFRSLVVPLKAILMNLLSVGAAYGLLVLVFQKGWGAELLGLQQVEYIEAWIPLFLFAILFGTSMDYHVFLLSRIREHFDEGYSNTESVAFGLGSTARIITGAAVIMVAVFGGFAAGDLVMFQQLGFGLAVAVLLDATIVRTVLVPAAMKLLGDANWWLPSGLRWLPDLRVEAKPVRVKTEEAPCCE
ncbi:MAG: MMPL family transporter [Thermoleophilia bacterium]